MTYTNESVCRSCGSSNLAEILDLGETPLADRLLTIDELEETELSAPLTLVFCRSCSLTQIRETVEPSILFNTDYQYFSSVSKASLAHFRASALDIMAMRKLHHNSLVIEAASNDGYMLRNFLEACIPVLGIDPAQAPALAALQSGIPTLCTFFGFELADHLKKEGKQADVFLANNILAQVPDLNGFVAGIRKILKNDGMAVIEVPYVVDLIDHCEFDAINHQYLCYFSVTALVKLFRRHGLHLNDAQRIAIRGGSLRLFLETQEDMQLSVRYLLQFEAEHKVDQIDYYQDFSVRVARIRHSLRGILEQVKQENCRIAGYGAAVKATTLMAYCGIDQGYLDYIVDLDPHNHGRYMGKNHLEIFPTHKLLEDHPEYVLILTWNSAQEIIQQQKAYSETGGRYIIPIPEPSIVE